MKHILSILLILLLCSCSAEEILLPIGGEQGEAIAFAYGMEEEAAVQQGGSGRKAVRRKAAVALQSDFTVWGYKTKPGPELQQVFNGYTVEYTENTAHTTESNTHDYEYVGGGQTIKYWDYGASEYRFWGATGGSFNTDGTTLTLSGLTLTTTEPTSSALYSQLYQRSPVSSDVVQLQFKRPYAKVRLLFYTTEEQTGDDQILLTDISFSGGTASIVNSGSMTITYPQSGSATETITVTGDASPGSTQDALSFGNVTLDATHGTASNNAVLAVPTGGTEWYYTLPVTSSPAAFTLSLNIDDDPKTAVVPAGYMQWQPNTCYTYIFKITEAGKKIEIYDVLIEPWKYGGSQEETWTNW